MTILEAIRSYALDQAAVAAMLADPSGFFVAQAPQKVPRRYVLLHQLGQPGQHHLGGVSNRTRTAFQLESYASTREEAVALDAQLQSTLDGYRGVLTASVWCHELLKDDCRGPLPIDLQDGDGHPAFVVQTDYHAWHSPRI